MPLFYFDFQFGETIEADDVGTEFPTLQDAYLDACRSALEMSLERLRTRHDPNVDSVEILDAQRRSLMQVPFSDVLRPKPLRSSALRDRSNQLIGSCHEHLSRGKRLKAEIGEELRKMQAMSLDIRASVQRLR
jgi:hypothetical protein